MTELSQRVEAAIRDRREIVNDAIIEELPIVRPERLYEASRYLLDAGGKRLRPTISLLVAEALTDIDPDTIDYRSVPATDDGEVDVMSAAVAVEVIQSFTLIHDDIMDDD
ncbi:MAG: polyprenyl synthetase family protein, partial [Haloarculaceae archaeon]